MQNQQFVEEVIPKIVNEGINRVLTMLPSSSEIKNVVFSLNKDGAPGPDGFGAFFFQTYWDIIRSEVESATLQFFKQSYLLPNFNANTLACCLRSREPIHWDNFDLLQWQISNLK